jgi:UDP-galactopyranose mutase
MKHHDVVIVGAGFYGCTLAEKFASAGKSVLILEKRDHVGGNAYSYFDASTGIEIHKYGSHIFHTNSHKIWEYINLFTSFNSYTHKVLSKAGSLLLPVPINLETINLVFDKKFSPEEARHFLESQKINSFVSQDNLEAWAISEVGTKLYEILIRGYTHKQWEIDPSLLPASIITRLPVRFDYEDRYFTDTYQGMPINGYEKIFLNMLSDPKIDLELGTDFFGRRDSLSSDQVIIYSGPLDRFFGYSKGKLSWRTLDFEFEKVEKNFYQENSVINYADVNTPYTRIHEFKHFHPERSQSSESTIIAREYSRRAEIVDEPYYPVGTVKDKKILNDYKDLSAGLTNVYFGGRLGSYQYLDMHMAINQAMITFNEIMEERWG